MNTPHASILLVDDDESAIELFRAILQPEGCTVVAARDGVEALEKYDQYQPDLVLLDLMLPRLNGYEVCAHLRNHPRSREVPIIMTSGLDERDARTRALDSGVSDFLPKPIDHRELVSRIRTQLKLHLCHQCSDRHRNVLANIRARTEHLQRTLHLMSHCDRVRADEQLAELLTEGLETCNQLGEAIAS